MDEVLKLLSNPLVWKLLVGYWVFNAIVDALVPPTDKSSNSYRFVYRLGQSLGGNLKRAASELHVPGAKEN